MTPLPPHTAIRHCPICGQDRARHEDRYCEIMRMIWGVPASDGVKK